MLDWYSYSAKRVDKFKDAFGKDYEENQDKLDKISAILTKFNVKHLTSFSAWDHPVSGKGSVVEIFVQSVHMPFNCTKELFDLFHEYDRGFYYTVDEGPALFLMFHNAHTTFNDVQCYPDILRHRLAFLEEQENG